MACTLQASKWPLYIQTGSALLASLKSDWKLSKPRYLFDMKNISLISHPPAQNKIIIRAECDQTRAMQTNFNDNFIRS